MYIVEIVTNGFNLFLQVKKHRVEGHEENYWANWVTLKYSPLTLESVGPPMRCINHRVAIGVGVGEVTENICGRKFLLRVSSMSEWGKLPKASSIALHYTAHHCTALHCIALHCIALH